MTKREAMDLTAQENRLMSLGISRTDADTLRRISMTLRRWFERECGTDNGCIERDEATNKAYWLDSISMKRYPIADRETGARKRLDSLMSRYPMLTAYIQSDPRGCALYILTAEQLQSVCPNCQQWKHDGRCLNDCQSRGFDHSPTLTIDSIYTRGVTVS